jgi:hypothetical protein
LKEVGDPATGQHSRESGICDRRRNLRVYGNVSRHGAVGKGRRLPRNR